MALTLDGTAGITFPSGSGTQAAQSKVLQVVNATTNSNSSTSNSSWTAAGFSASITPLFSTSKVLIICQLCVAQTASNGDAYYTIYKNGSTNLGNSSVGLANIYTNAVYTNPFRASLSIVYLDSPATTSATTYALYFQTNTVGTAQINNEATTSTITLMEISA